VRFALLARGVRRFAPRDVRFASLARGVCFASLARDVLGFASRGWMRLRRVLIQGVGAVEAARIVVV